MVKIERLRIKGLYSFKDEMNIEFDSNNLIIGHNNAGKTNIFRIFKLIIPALSNTYDIGNNIRFNKIDELPILEFDIVFEKSEVDHISEFLTFSLIGNLSTHTSELKLFSTKFSKLRRFTFRIEFPDTGREKSDQVDLYCIEKSTGLVIIHTHLNSPFFTTVDMQKIDYQNNVQTIPSIIDQLLKQKVPLKNFTPKKFVDFMNKHKQGFILRSVQNISSHNASDLRKLNLLRSKYANQNNQTLEFFVLISKIISEKLSYMSDRRQIKETSKDETTQLLDDGTNLASYLHKLKSHKEKQQQNIVLEIKKQFTKIFDKKISFETYDEEKTELIENKAIRIHIPKIAFYSDKIQFNDDDVGSGVLEVVFLITKSITEKYSLILLDEPALHLHPIQIKRTFAQIQKNILKSKSQLFIISHSVNLPLTMFLEKDHQLIYVRVHMKSSIISQLNEIQKTNLIEFIPKLKFDLSADLFFAKKLILVEGDSDLGLLEGLANRKKINIDQKDVLIKPINGKDNLTLLLQLLDYFKIPRSIMVDKDALMQISQKNVSRVIASLHKLDPASVNNLLSKLGEKIIHSEFRTPWWIDLLKKESSKIDSSQVKNFVVELSKKHQKKIQVYDASLYVKLARFAEQRNIFVIEEGSIEDLMQKIDSQLYNSLKSDYRSKRIRAQKFIEIVDSSKLKYFKIPNQVLSQSVKV